MEPFILMFVYVFNIISHISSWAISIFVCTPSSVSLLLFEFAIQFSLEWHFPPLILNSFHNWILIEIPTLVNSFIRAPWLFSSLCFIFLFYRTMMMFSNAIVWRAQITKIPLNAWTICFEFRDRTNHLRVPIQTLLFDFPSQTDKFG